MKGEDVAALACAVAIIFFGVGLILGSWIEGAGFRSRNVCVERVIESGDCAAWVARK